MMSIDFSPLYRSTIGFDRLADLFDSAQASEAGGFPPYNIEATGENAYRITMAVAGFGEGELSVVQDGNVLMVTGKGRNNRDEGQYLYRGIAGRDFERRFQLAEYVKVGEARLENGLLTIDLLRELPEALRPRKIKIGTGHKRLFGKAA